MAIKFHRVSDNFKKNPDSDVPLPVRATEGSSGYDFYSPIDVIIPPNNSGIVKIWTDVKVELPKGFELIITPRSSCGTIILVNTVGKIDSDYFSNSANDGNIGAFIRNWGNEPVEIHMCDRFIQGSIYQYFITDDDVPLSATRSGGFGHSGV